jgi:glycosyltransferase involved in cell wall biosynthesis
MRVCYFGTYREEYPRNQIMIAGLRLVGVEVIECHVQLWTGIQDRISAATGGWRSPKFWWRMLTTYIRLLWKFISLPNFDVLIVGYPGQFDIYLAKLLSMIRHKPLVWDVFMSIYLISQERSLDREAPFSIHMLYQVEKTALTLPDLLIQDTGQYVQWFVDTYGLSADRFVLVPTGADDRIFHPIRRTPKIEEDKSHLDSVCRVIYYGTFIPNHSVVSIIEAARLLKGQEIVFTLIGDGPDKPEAQQMASRYQLTNVSFLDWMDKQDLIHFIDQSDIFLGAFGDTPQSIMTVQNKIFEGMAMRKPVITGISEAVQEFFQHKQSVYLCERKNAVSLADAIQTLAKDTQLSDRIAENGYKAFQEQFTVKALGKKYRSHLDKLVSSRR